MTYSSSRILRPAALVLRVVLGAIFIYAAWLKLKDPWALFAMNIDSYQVLPLWAVRLVARTLPWFEMTLGVLLIVGKFRRTSTTIVALLLTVFFALIIRAYAKGMEINCGCFGPGEAISWKTMLRDGSMLAGAIFTAVMSYLTAPKNASPQDVVVEPAYRA